MCLSETFYTERLGNKILLSIILFLTIVDYSTLLVVGHFQKYFSLTLRTLISTASVTTKPRTSSRFCFQWLLTLSNRPEENVKSFPEAKSKPKLRRFRNSRISKAGADRKKHLKNNFKFLQKTFTFFKSNNQLQSCCF